MIIGRYDPVQPLSFGWYRIKCFVVLQPLPLRGVKPNSSAPSSTENLVQEPVNFTPVAHFIFQGEGSVSARAARI